VARDYRERMGLRALKPANVVKPEAKPDVKPDVKPDIKPAAPPAPTVGELKARLRARGIPEQKIAACLEKRELVALLAEAEAPSPPAASMAPPAPPPPPPSQASAASQPFVYDLAGSSSDEEDGGDAKRLRLSEESSRSLPSSFFCAISHSVMRDPVVCADGMTYERAYIESWLLAHDTSPLTNQPLAHKLLVPNIALKQAIDEMLERV
jgi:hypothetical protein